MILGRLPLKVRLVAGFALGMTVLLTAAGGFVFWRVRYALDRRLDQDLSDQSTDLRLALQGSAEATRALASLGGEGRDARVLDSAGTVLARGTDLSARGPLLTAAQLRQATLAPVHAETGSLFSGGGGRHLRILAVPVPRTGGPTEVAVAVVRLDQRDEALRELLAQLALANAGALAIASLVGYRLARAALSPVERYRAEAERIAAGASGVRLELTEGADDELTRLGHTLNAMLDTQETALRQQQQFIDDASHDLRTPLSVLAAEVDVALRKSRSAGELEATLERIRGDIAGLARLADDLLTLGAHSTEPAARQPVAVAPLLTAAAERARGRLAGDREITVRCGLDLIDADQPMLERALDNLLDNAALHGAGPIVLSAAGPVPVLSVHDSGTDLDPSFLAHAAERFRRGDTARAGTGSGLGLAIVDAIAAAHQGQLRICAGGAHHRRPQHLAAADGVPCTHPEVGTTVSLVLP